MHVTHTQGNRNTYKLLTRKTAIMRQVRRYGRRLKDNACTEVDFKK